jgi:hypothetical protein
MLASIRPYVAVRIKMHHDYLHRCVHKQDRSVISAGFPQSCFVIGHGHFIAILYTSPFMITFAIHSTLHKPAMKIKVKVITNTFPLINQIIHSVERSLS